MSVVQSVAANGLAGVTSKTFTLSATAAGNMLVIEIGIEAGGTVYTGFSVSDNGSGNTWASAVVKTGGIKTAGVLRCLSVSAGVTSVTVTPTGGTGGMYGAASIQEVSGGTWSDDKNGSATLLGGTLTATASGADVGTTDFVGAACAIGNGATNCGISDPPTGYTSAAVSQNDNTDTGAECCYRINSSAVTDSVTWTATSWQSGDPGAVASFKVTAGGGGGSSGYSRARTSGPGISPDYRQLFTARRLSSALSPILQGSGTSALQFGQAGTLTGSGALTGTSTLTFGQSGAIGGAGALAGVSALTFGQSGTLTQPGLQGTAGLAFGQSGTLAASGVLAGASALQFGQTAALTANGAMSGTSILTFAQTANLAAVGILAGSSALTFAQTAALTGSGALAGSSALTFGASATADQPAGALSGTASIAFDQAGTLDGSAALQGLAALVFGAVGINSIVVSQPGPVDSPLMSDGAFRRRKKRRLKKVLEEVDKPDSPGPTPAESIPAPRVPAPMVSARSLADIARSAMDPEPEVDLSEQDDQEALRAILQALGL